MSAKKVDGSHLVGTPTESMRPQERHRVRPGESDPPQEDPLHLVASGGGRETISRTRARVRVLPAPREGVPHVQGVVDRRLADDCVRGRDPKIGPRHVGVPPVVERLERAVRAPDFLGQSGVGGMARIEAPVGPHRIAAIAVVIHEVVRGQSHYTAQEAAPGLGVGDILPQRRDVAVDRFVRANREAPLR